MCCDIMYKMLASNGLCGFDSSMGRGCRTENKSLSTHRVIISKTVHACVMERYTWRTQNALPVRD